MRRLTAVVLAVAMSLFTSTPMFAAARARRAGPTGNVNGVAQNSQGQNLANYTVRIRNVANGQLAGSTMSGATGQFSFAGLDPGNYVVEIVDQVGNIIGTSAAVSVAEGATVAVTVGATGMAAAATATAGGTAFIASTAGIITVAAVGAGVAGAVVAANRTNASPSR